MTPDLGQGGAQAIEDAFYLAKSLEEFNGISIEKAFTVFHNNRKEKVQKLVSLSRRTSKIASINHFSGLRNTTLKLIPEKYTRNQMLNIYNLKEC